MTCVTYFEVKSPKRGAKLRLDASFFVIGRGERIPIFHDDPSISREHAAIVIRAGGVRLRDLGSKNGVLLNGERIEKYAEVDVKPGDSLRVGATILVLHEGEPPVVAKPVAAAEPARAATAEPAATAAAATTASATTEPVPAPAPAAASEVEDLELAEEEPPAPISSDEEDDAEAAPQLE